MGEPVVVDVAQLLQPRYASFNRFSIMSLPGDEPLAQFALAARAIRKYSQSRGHHFITLPARLFCIGVIFLDFSPNELVTRLRFSAARVFHLVTCSVPSKSQLTNCLVSGLVASSAPVRLRDRSMSSRA
jgi:hypothetical protein